MMYEVRLEGGKIFHMGPLTGLLGGLSINKAPDFCNRPDFPACAREGGRGVWNVRAIDDYARRPHRPMSDSSAALSS
jgi:hypothetical protein